MALCNTVDVVDIFQHVHYQLSRVGHSYNFGQFLISCMMIPWQPSWFVFQQHRCLLDLAHIALGLSRAIHSQSIGLCD